MEQDYTTIDTLAAAGVKAGKATLGLGALATAGLMVTPVVLGHLALEGVRGTAQYLGNGARGMARDARRNLGDYLANNYQTEQ